MTIYNRQMFPLLARTGRATEQQQMLHQSKVRQRSYITSVIPKYLLNMQVNYRLAQEPPPNVKM